MTACGENQPIRSDDLSLLDTGRGSLLHMLAPGPGQTCSVWRSFLAPYVISAAVFYGVPLLTTAFFNPESLVACRGTLKEPFFRDYNLLFMSFVSFPLIVIMLMSERALIPSSLKDIIETGVLSSKPDRIGGFCFTWKRRYLWVNVSAQVVGLGVGVAIAKWQKAEWNDGLTDLLWQSSGGTLTAGGMVNVWFNILVFWWVASIYIIRAFATTAFLFSLTKHRKILPQPFHHDRCAGLRSVGRIGLRNQYMLAACGLNLVVLLVTVIPLLASVDGHIPQGPVRTFVVSCIAYLTLGPAVFLVPLFPFRKSMMKVREELLAKVAKRSRRRYLDIIRRVETEGFTAEDQEAVRRLETLEARVRRIPVWPFDVSTLRRFVAIYILPALLIVMSAAVGSFVQWLLSFVV